MADEAQTGQQSSSQGTSQAASASTSQQDSGSQKTGTNTQSETQSQQNSGTQAAAQQIKAPVRPEYVPESHWDTTAGKVKDDKAFASFVNEHVAYKAAEDVKRLTLPQTPDAYKVELPADFKPPEGIEFKFRDNDPLLSQAKTMAHSMGISQDNFGKLLGLYAGAQVATQQEITTARNAEIAKLGTTGPARVTAITTFFKAMLGDAGGDQMAARMFTASDIANAEKLIVRFSTQGSGTFSNRGREADIGVKLDDAAYDKLTYTEKKEYAARHPQGNGAG